MMLFNLHVFGIIPHQILELLHMQRVCCQLNTLLAVIWHFGKCRMLRLSCLLLGFDDIGLFLVSMGLGSNSAFVGLNLAGTSHVAFDLGEFGFRGRCSHLFSP